MSPLWSYFWPCFAAGLLAAFFAGLIAFRRAASGTRRSAALGIGFAVALVSTGLWSGPLGGADRFEAEVEGDLKRALVYYEMTQISAHLHHGPLTRRLLLSGPADDFQRSELVRLLNQLPGVRETVWDSREGGLPLIAEGVAVSLAGFLLGLLLAYLVELRRRYNAQWTW